MAASAKNGATPRTPRQDQWRVAMNSPNTGNNIKTGKIHTDSLEAAASRNATTAVRYQPQAPRHWNHFVQPTHAIIPNRNTSRSLEAASHMTASWCPSKTAKKHAAQK